MNSVKQINFSIKRADFINASAVYTLMLIFKPSTNNMLLNKIHNFIDFSFAALEFFVKFFMNCRINRKQSFVANELIIGVECFFNILNAEIFNFFKNFRIGIGGFISKLRLADFINDALNELNHLFVFLMACHNGVKHNIIRNFVTAGFDHGNKICRGSNGKSKIGFFSLLKSGVKNYFAINKAYIYGRNRAVPRDIGNCDCSGNTDCGSNLG